MSDQTKVSLLRTCTLILAIFGLISVAIAVGGDLIRPNFKTGFGVIQMATFLAGISLLTLSAYLQIYRKRPQENYRSLQADIGIRLGLTGLVFAIVSGMSDLIGVGTHQTPRFDGSFIGPLQVGGVGLGMALIFLGLGLYFTSRGKRKVSSLEFMIAKDDEETDEEA